VRIQRGEAHNGKVYIPACLERIGPRSSTLVNARSSAQEKCDMGPEAEKNGRAASFSGELPHANRGLWIVLQPMDGTLAFTPALHPIVNG
jgi:hypothetical protein